MNPTNPQVDAYFDKAEKWQKELKKLRKIVLGCGLTEELKWGKPCYTFEESNVAILYSLKESCAVGFLKGSLLKDAEGILIKPGENSQAGRWIKFTSSQQIGEMEPVVKAYLQQAIDAEKAGLEVDFKAIKELVYPEELQKMLDDDAALKKAFESLTPGRRRAYNLHFSAPKQSKTRISRIEKCTPQILAGKGMNDR